MIKIHNYVGKTEIEKAIKEGNLLIDDLSETPEQYRERQKKDPNAIMNTDTAIWMDTHKTEHQEYLERISVGIRFFVDTMDMARQFYNIQPLYYDRNQNWWIWDYEQYKWKGIDETDILIMIDSVLRIQVRTYTSGLKSEIIECLRRVGRSNAPQEIKNTWVQFKNQIIDFETGERFIANKNFFVVNPINVSLGNSEETPVMDSLFKSWVGEEHVKKLYQILAYCCLPDYPIHRIFCFVGTGSNGKSRYLALLTKFLGADNCGSADLDSLMNNRFETIKFYKKLIVQMGETNFEAMNKTNMLKRLCGQDMIGFEQKNKPCFDGYNYAKIIISTNGLPVTNDKSVGFYRRWLLIKFPNSFSNESDILKTIPEVEYRNLACKCITLLKELLGKGGFDNEGSVEDRRRMYEDVSNPLQKFLEEETVRDYDAYIFKYEFKDYFKIWMTERGHRMWSDHELNLKMKESYAEAHKGSNSYRAWVGLRFKTKEEKVTISQKNVPTESTESTGIYTSTIHTCNEVKSLVDSVGSVGQIGEIDPICDKSVIFEEISDDSTICAFSAKEKTLKSFNIKTLENFDEKNAIKSVENLKENTDYSASELSHINLEKALKNGEIFERKPDKYRRM